MHRLKSTSFVAVEIDPRHLFWLLMPALATSRAQPALDAQAQLIQACEDLSSDEAQEWFEDLIQHVGWNKLGNPLPVVQALMARGADPWKSSPKSLQEAHLPEEKAAREEGQWQAGTRPMAITVETQNWALLRAFLNHPSRSRLSWSMLAAERLSDQETSPKSLLEWVSRFPELGHVLLDAGMDPDTPDADGCSMLFYVHDLALGDRLIKEGAHTNCVNTAGQTPYLFQSSRVGPLSKAGQKWWGQVHRTHTIMSSMDILDLFYQGSGETIELLFPDGLWESWSMDVGCARSLRRTDVLAARLLSDALLQQYQSGIQERSHELEGLLSRPQASIDEQLLGVLALAQWMTPEQHHKSLPLLLEKWGLDQDRFEAHAGTAAREYLALCHRLSVPVFFPAQLHSAVGDGFGAVLDAWTEHLEKVPSAWTGCYQWEDPESFNGCLKEMDRWSPSRQAVLLGLALMEDYLVHMDEAASSMVSEGVVPPHVSEKLIQRLIASPASLSESLFQGIRQLEDKSNRVIKSSLVDEIEARCRQARVHRPSSVGKLRRHHS